jgi:hypothetical protein
VVAAAAAAASLTDLVGRVAAVASVRAALEQEAAAVMAASVPSVEVLLLGALSVEGVKMLLLRAAIQDELSATIQLLTAGFLEAGAARKTCVSREVEIRSVGEAEVSLLGHVATALCRTSKDEKP